jgi:DNA polymerase
MGVDPQRVVDGWRELHAPIVRFWRAVDDAFKGAVRGETSRVDRFEFVPSSDGNNVAIFLPSGRPIVYNGGGLERGEHGPSAYYVGAYGTREHIYGGKITENVIQAMCRDLLADALVRAEEAGLCPVLHVHDEIVCDVPAQAGAEALAELERIMLDVPEWAEGFPVGASCHYGERYRK